MAWDTRGVPRFALLGRWGAALALTLTAAIAALLAHLCIDSVGDFALAHDSYDDLAHGSRSLVGLGALAVAVFVAGRSFFAALDSARVGLARARRIRVVLAPRKVVGYLAVVVGLTFALLALMERADLFAAGQTPDDLADLFGGSLALGASLTLAVALAMGAVVWYLARWIAVAHLVAARFIAAAFIERSRPNMHVFAARARRAPRRFSLAPVLARSVGKRGPPALR